MPDKPTISVVMCTCNGENRHLREQLDSILTQTLLPNEVIIQDDCSTDGTMAILEEYAHRAPSGVKICFSGNAKRLGINDNFFGAMAKATCDYIAISDQDDIWLPTKLERQMATIGNNMMCVCRSEPFCENGAVARYDRRKPNCNLIRLFYASMMGHCQFFKRDLLQYVPTAAQCPEIYRRTLYDVILGTVAAALDSITLLDEVLVRQRRYADAATYVAYDKHRVRSADNALSMVLYGLMHYRSIKPFMNAHFKARLDFLKCIKADNKIYRDGLRLLESESRSGLRALVKTTLMYVKYRHTLFYTRENDPVAFVRALLHPFMQIYNYSYLQHRKY